MIRDGGTPALFLGQLIAGKPRPWEHFDIDGLVVNAYEIIRKKIANHETREKGVHGYLKFNGPVLMDSGGFLFMKQSSMEGIKPMQIMELYEQARPDYGVVLDYPLGSSLPASERRKRLLRTLKNTESMVRMHEQNSFRLIPVIHGNSLRTIERYLEKLQKIGDFDMYGIGSLVPSVFNSKGVGGIYNVVRIVSYIRKRLPDKRLHVFGVGSALTMHLMFYVGADSVDSSGWRTKAAFGAIQLPGVGDRYITIRERNKAYRNLSDLEKNILRECECPVCKEHELEDLIEKFSLRALHNAWVFQKEVETARKLIGEKGYEEYVERVLRNKNFFHIFEFARQLRIKGF